MFTQVIVAAFGAALIATIAAAEPGRPSVSALEVTAYRARSESILRELEMDWTRTVTGSPHVEASVAFRTYT